MLKGFGVPLPFLKGFSLSEDGYKAGISPPPNPRGIRLYFYVLDFGEWDPGSEQELGLLGAQSEVQVEITTAQYDM